VSSCRHAGANWTLSVDAARVRGGACGARFLPREKDFIAQQTKRKKVDGANLPEDGAREREPKRTGRTKKV
jgi:hypothetical protein